MFCPNCGKKNSKDAKFCEYCGEKFTSLLDENQKPISTKNSVDDNKLSDQEIYQVALLISEAKHAANRMIMGGVGWIVAGLVLTAATGGFLIFWGAPLYGVYRLIKGSYYRAMPHKLIKDVFGGSKNDVKKEEKETGDNKEKSNLHWE